MARQKGMLNLSGNLEPLAGAPLDSRSITPTVADLYIASNWPYKYIGMKTTVTATGDTYRLVNLDVTQESSWVKEGGESGQTIQHDELPAASSSLAGEIYQYTGTTNLQYTNGYFYECVNDGGTYKWVQTNVQPGTSYNDFTGATAQAAGAHGLVPAPTTGDIAKFLKGDGTWATVPMPSFDYSNTSPEAMNFSTDEKVIGTWTDGKPLYQKVLTLQNVSYNWNTTNSYGISNIDHVVSSSVRIHYKKGSSEWWFTPYCKGSNEYVTFTFDEHDFRAIWSNTSEIQNIYETEIILRYTKTTDTAVASGEKIVGQWIDGKPIWQKTYKVEVPNTGSDTQVQSIAGLNADKIVDYKQMVMHANPSDFRNESRIDIKESATGLNNQIQRVSVWISSDYIYVRNSASYFVGDDLYITLQYTKTS